MSFGCLLPEKKLIRIWGKNFNNSVKNTEFPGNENQKRDKKTFLFFCGDMNFAYKDSCGFGLKGAEAKALNNYQIYFRCCVLN